MNKDEDLLKGFFEEMKQEDLRLQVPDIASMAGNRRNTNHLKPWMGIAAGVSIFLSIGVYWYSKSNSGSEQQNYSLAAPFTSDQLNAGEVNMMTWETPTDELLTDF